MVLRGTAQCCLTWDFEAFVDRLCCQNPFRSRINPPLPLKSHVHNSVWSASWEKAVLLWSLESQEFTVEECHVFQQR